MWDKVSCWPSCNVPILWHCRLFQQTGWPDCLLWLPACCCPADSLRTWGISSRIASWKSSWGASDYIPSKVPFVAKQTAGFVRLNPTRLFGYSSPRCQQCLKAIPPRTRFSTRPWNLRSWRVALAVLRWAIGISVQGKPLWLITLAEARCRSRQSRAQSARIYHKPHILSQC